MGYVQSRPSHGQDSNWVRSGAQFAGVGGHFAGLVNVRFGRDSARAAGPAETHRGARRLCLEYRQQSPLAGASAAECRALDDCHLGRDPIGPILDERMEGKTIAGRPLRAIRVNRPEELGNCDVVFMDQPTDSAVAAAAEAVAGRPVLSIVFEAEGGRSAAGVDLLLTREGTVRYKLAVSALKRAGLVPSPGLLQYALKGAARE